MSNVLTTVSIIGCPHFIPAAPPVQAKGQVQFTGVNNKLMVQKNQVLVKSDFLSATVGSCPMVNAPNPPTKTCLKVLDVITGASSKLMVGGIPVMLDTLAGDTDGFPPPVVPPPPVYPTVKGNITVIQVQNKLTAS